MSDHRAGAEAADLSSTGGERPVPPSHSARSRPAFTIVSTALRAFGFVPTYFVAAAGSVHLLTIGLLSFRHRAFLAELAARYGYRRHGDVQTSVPTVCIEDIVEDTIEVQLHSPERRDGNVALLELLVLARLAKRDRPRTIFEIGTFDGATTLNLAANAPSARVYTLDLPAAEQDSTELATDPHERQFVEKDVTGLRFRGSVYERRIEQLWGDSARFDFSAFTGRVDLVFVDGSHSYEYVMRDSISALALLPTGSGTIVWHDYGRWAGVTRALERLHRENPSFRGLRWIEGTTLVILQRP